jgi:sulfofructosephosphate aldolase
VISDPELRARRFAALARPSGALALVAIDQRESLRSMLRAAQLPATDDDLARFKIAAAAALTPQASGLLVDPAYGLAPVLDAHALAPQCGLIVAGDRITAVGDQVVGESRFDAALDLNSFVAAGAVALKLLVLWRREDLADARRAMVGRFLARCADLGVLSLVEGVVRGVDPARDPDGHSRAVLEAARDLTEDGPDLYKAEVPTHGLAEAGEIEAASRAITATVPCPWVVLSAGTAPDAYPGGVHAACRGGASGFLAGRAIWAPALARAENPVDLERRLRTDAVGRLERLIAIVDESARAWSAAA